MYVQYLKTLWDEICRSLLQWFQILLSLAVCPSRCLPCSQTWEKTGKRLGVIKRQLYHWKASIFIHIRRNIFSLEQLREECIFLLLGVPGCCCCLCKVNFQAGQSHNHWEISCKICQHPMIFLKFCFPSYLDAMMSMEELVSVVHWHVHLNMYIKRYFLQYYFLNRDRNHNSTLEELFLCLQGWV